MDIAQTTVGVDATALLTLSYLNVLDKALDAFMAVYVPHSTLAWLFEEQHKAPFHQPSRIRDAHQLRIYWREMLWRGLCQVQSPMVNWPLRLVMN